MNTLTKSAKRLGYFLLVSVFCIPLKTAHAKEQTIDLCEIYNTQDVLTLADSYLADETLKSVLPALAHTTGYNISEMADVAITDENLPAAIQKTLQLIIDADCLSQQPAP